MLEDCAEHDAMLMPTHFAVPFCCRISAAANGGCDPV